MVDKLKKKLVSFILSNMMMMFYSSSSSNCADTTDSIDTWLVFSMASRVCTELMNIDLF